MDSLQGLFNGLAGLAVVLGLVYCFAGYRIRRFIFAVPGYIAGAAIVGALAYLLSQEMWVAVLAGVFAGGPIGASIVLALYNVKVFSIGLLLGVVIDVALYLITDGQIEPAVLLIIPIVTGILALIHDKWAIVVGTAFGGAGLAVGGIAYFAFGGVSPAAIMGLLEGAPSLLAATLGGWLALGITGVVVQYQTLKPQDRADWRGGSGGGSEPRSSRFASPASIADGRSSSRATPGPRRQALTGHRGQVGSIIWDPYGRWFATAGEYGDVYLWDPGTGRPLHQLWRSSNAFRDEDSLRVSPDGSWLAAYSYRGERWIWDTATGRVLAGPDSEPGDDRYALAVDPAGNVWDRTAWARIREGEDWVLTDTAADPNGRWVASRDHKGKIRVWDTRSGRRLQQMTARRDYKFYQLLASGDGRWLILRAADCLDFWLIDGPRSDQSEHFDGTPGVHYWYTGKRVGQHCFAVTGREEVRNRIFQMWELSDVPKLLWQKTFPSDSSSSLLAASPTGHWLVCTVENNIAVLDAVSGNRLHSFPARSADAYVAAFTASPGGRALAAAFQDGSVALFDLATGTCRHGMPGHRRSLNALEMAPDGNWLAAAGTSGVVCLWDATTGRQIGTLKGHRGDNHGGVVAMAASRDRSWLATVDANGSVIIWDIRTRAPRQAIHVSSLSADKTRLAWAPDDRHLALRDDNHNVRNVRLFDTRTGEVVSTSDRLDVAANLLNLVRYHFHRAMGRSLASGFLFEDLSFWGLYHEQLAAQSPKEARRQSWGRSLGFAFHVALQFARGIGLLPGETSIEGIAPSPDSAWLATPGESAGISVRDSRTGNVLHELQGHQGAVKSLAVHPNGRWLFSAGLDGVIRRWDMSCLPAKPVCDLAMEALPDDNWVVWEDPDGPKRRWLLDRSSPGAKRWLGWHAPIKGTDRWAHQPMDAYPQPP